MAGLVPAIHERRPSGGTPNIARMGHRHSALALQPVMT
jgi:hypothetical protein